MKTFKTSEGEIFTEEKLLADFAEFPDTLTPSDIQDILSLKVGEQVYTGTEWVIRIK